jgi:hypothetical protein
MKMDLQPDRATTPAVPAGWSSFKAHDYVVAYNYLGEGVYEWRIYVRGADISALLEECGAVERPPQWIDELIVADIERQRAAESDDVDEFGDLGGMPIPPNYFDAVDARG